MTVEEAGRMGGRENSPRLMDQNFTVKSAVKVDKRFVGSSRKEKLMKRIMRPNY